jgi:hypothetical protein
MNQMGRRNSKGKNYEIYADSIFNDPKYRSLLKYDPPVVLFLYYLICDYCCLPSLASSDSDGIGLGHPFLGSFFLSGQSLFPIASH